MKNALGGGYQFTVKETFQKEFSHASSTYVEDPAQ